MTTMLVRNATVVATMDNDRREIPNGALFIRDNVIEQVGPTSELPASADEVLDLSDHIVLPGMVNTHHHMYQTLTRVVPAAQDAALFDWLKTLYPIWANLTAEGVYTSTMTALAELALSGCTTSSDHLYLFPNDSTLDDQIRAAQEIGVRFHAARGSMSLGESKGGLPPDRVVQDEATILKDCQRLVETYHNPDPYSMLRIVLAPCSPFSVTGDLMRETTIMAREYGVTMHTHLAETHDEEQFCLEMFGKKPVAYMEELGWLGDDVWHAHCVHVDSEEINTFASSGTGVAHCPTSNMRIASGIAPVVAMLQSGVKVGLGVDGSASNDSSHMLNEARQALLLQRVGGDPAALTAREALELATLGGASALGRDDIGSLAVGKAADFIAYKLDTLAMAGFLHDPVAAVVFAASPTVDLSVINGKVVVKEGRLTTVEIEPIIEKHNALSKTMINAAS